MRRYYFFHLTFGKDDSSYSIVLQKFLLQYNMDVLNFTKFLSHTVRDMTKNLKI